MDESTGDNPDEFRVDIYSNNEGASVRVTHLPTGIVASRVAGNMGSLAAREMCIAEIRAKIRQGSDHVSGMYEVTHPLGVYEHYKGKRYLLLGYGHDANSDEFFYNDEEQRWPNGDRVVMVYVPLYFDRGPRIAVRDVDDWDRVICVNAACDSYGRPIDGPFDACARCEDKGRPRFQYIGR